MAGKPTATPSAAATGAPTWKGATTTTGRLQELVSEHSVSLRALRVELDALRAEHRALRACLHDRNVLSSKAFEDECRKEDYAKSLQALQLFQAVAPGSLASSGSVGAPEEPVGPGRGSVGSGHSDSSGAVKTAAKAAPAQRPSVAGSPGTWQGRATATNATRTQPSSPQRRASGQRERTPSAERQRSGRLSTGSSGPERPRRSNSGGPAPAPKGPPNLYRAAAPLLQAGCTKEQAEAALAEVRNALEFGCSPNQWQGQSTPCRAAAQAGRADLLQMLIEGKANPNESDDKGVSILHMAAFDGHAHACKVLMDLMADVNVTDRHGQTPLFFVPNAAVCKVLFQGNADVNAVNQKGQTALHLAGRAGLAEVLAWLAPHVARHMLELKDVHGATPAYYARHAGVSQEVLIRCNLLSFAPPSQLLGRSALMSPAFKTAPLPNRSPATPSSSPKITSLGSPGARSGPLPREAWEETLPPLPEDREAEDAAAGSGAPAPGERKRLVAATKIQAVARGAAARRLSLEAAAAASAAAAAAAAAAAKPPAAAAKAPASPKQAAAAAGAKDRKEGAATALEAPAPAGPAPPKPEEVAAATRIQAVRRGSLQRREYAAAKQQRSAGAAPAATVAASSSEDGGAAGRRKASGDRGSSKSSRSDAEGDAKGEPKGSEDEGAGAAEGGGEAAEEGQEGSGQEGGGGAEGEEEGGAEGEAEDP